MRPCLVLFCCLLTGSALGQPPVGPPSPVGRPAYNDRLLVVGGGGARGAWGAGYVKALSDSLGPYRVVFGTSTGSLMAPLIVLNKFELLKKGYTGVTQESIFNVNPFNEATGGLRGWNALWRSLVGKKSFGDTENLRKLIREFVPDTAYRRLVRSPDSLAIFVSVADFHSGKPSYPSSRQYAGAKNLDKDYQLFCNWIWASANQPLFMPYYEKTGGAYVDGGVLENVPLTAALEYAFNHPEIKEIDVIINKPLHPLRDSPFPTPERGVGKGLFRLIELWNLEVRNNDIISPQLMILAQDQQDARAELDVARHTLAAAHEALSHTTLAGADPATRRAVTEARQEIDSAQSLLLEVSQTLALDSTALSSIPTVDSLEREAHHQAAPPRSPGLRASPSASAPKKTVDLIRIHLHYFPPRLYEKEFTDKEGLVVRLNQKELLFNRDRMTEMWEAGEKREEDPEKPKLPIHLRHVDGNTISLPREAIKSLLLP